MAMSEALLALLSTPGASFEMLTLIHTYNPQLSTPPTADGTTHMTLPFRHVVEYLSASEERQEGQGAEAAIEVLPRKLNHLARLHENVSRA